LLLLASAISNLGGRVSVLAFRWLATLFARDPVPAFLLGAAEVVRDNAAHTF